MPTITEKIIQKHLVEGVMERGKPIAIRIDQTLTQDATGTMAYLQLEAMGVDQVKTDLSISYVDHNTLQSGFENADDHKYLQTVAMKHGVRSVSYTHLYSMLLPCDVSSSISAKAAGSSLPCLYCSS